MNPDEEFEMLHAMFASAEPDADTTRKNNIIKSVFIFVFLFEALGFGLLPVYCTAFNESPKVLGIANSFAGGVFIAIALMHIMPEQVTSWNDMQPKDKSGNPKDAYPLPFCIMVLGYSLMLTIDKVMFDAHAILEEDGHGHGHGHGGQGHDSHMPSIVVENRPSGKEEVVLRSFTDHKGSVIQTRVSMVQVENEIRRSMVASVRKSTRFAEQLKRSVASKPAYINDNQESMSNS